ncbi:MAG TPA: hypothetical protein PK395_20000, partial [bacterium]|nr:hypothetical protein [bacterium]
GVGVGVKSDDGVRVDAAARDTTPNIRIRKKDRISFIINLPVNGGIFRLPPSRNIPEFGVLDDL